MKPAADARCQLHSSLAGPRRLAPVAGALLALCIASCAPKPPALPTGAGLPFPEFAAAYSDATRECSGVRTITAAMNLSGRAGGTKLRGRIDAGFAAPADLRLEGVPPFGRPIFILVARGDESTLVLPRDNRVLRSARAAAIVEALAGVSLDPAEMRSAVAGCGLGPITATDGRSYPKGWAAIVGGETTTYVRQIEGRWRIVAVSRGALVITYADYAGGRPATVRLRTTPRGEAVASDLTLRLSQVEINTTLGPDVFDVDVPPDAAPLTLEELRRAGPLGR